MLRGTKNDDFWRKVVKRPLTTGSGINVGKSTFDTRMDDSGNERGRIQKIHFFTYQDAWQVRGILVRIRVEAHTTHARCARRTQPT
jgi:hypothetical protein